MFIYRANIRKVSYQADQDVPMSNEEALAWAAIQQTDILEAMLNRLEMIDNKLEIMDNTIAGK